MAKGWGRLGSWVLGVALLLPAPLGAQERPPTPAQEALRAPLALEDGKPTPPPSAPSAWRGLGSLLLVVGLAGLSLWGLRKVGRHRLPGGGGGRLRVEETLALGDRRFVSILSVEGERFLVALTPQNLSLLARLEGEAGAFEATLAQVPEAMPPLPVSELARRLRGEGA